MKFHKKPKLVAHREFVVEGFALVLDGLVQIFTLGNFQSNFFLNRAEKRVRNALERVKAKRKNKS